MPDGERTRRRPEQRQVELLKGLGFGEKLTFRKTLTSSVTSAWGVDWDEDMIARDLMQNFFDANRERIEEVRIDVDHRHVTVTAPAEFNLERLYYLGSEKGKEDVGQYGEGFKAASVCLLRKYPDALLVVGSGPDVVRIRVEDTPIEDTSMHPLVYEFFRTSSPTRGTRLMIRDTSAFFTRTMEDGLTHFFYDGNPLVGKVLAQDHTRSFRMFATSTADGHMFYRNLKRADIPGVPVCLVLNKEYKELERRIRGDRDRKAFGEELRNCFYKLWARHFFSGRTEAQRHVVQGAKAFWERGIGHPLLAEIATRRRWRSSVWGASESQAVFGDRYFARCHPTDAAARLRYETIEAEWSKQERTALPSYFDAFGVISAERHVQELERKAREEAARKQHREPTTTEFEGIRLLSEVVRSLVPRVMGIFDGRKTVYSVAETEVVLGELKESRSYRSHEVFLAASVFESDLARALAVFLHEHGHIFGYDGSRAFTDALTEIVEMVVRARHALDAREKTWDSLRAKLTRERRRKKAKDRDVLGRLAEMDASTLRELMTRMPAAYLETLLKPRPDQAEE